MEKTQKKDKKLKQKLLTVDDKLSSSSVEIVTIYKN